MLSTRYASSDVVYQSMDDECVFLAWESYGNIWEPISPALHHIEREAGGNRLQ
jgi:hypothetical protein